MSDFETHTLVLKKINICSRYKRSCFSKKNFLLMFVNCQELLGKLVEFSLSSLTFWFSILSLFIKSGQEYQSAMIFNPKPAKQRVGLMVFRKLCVQNERNRLASYLNTTHWFHFLCRYLLYNLPTDYSTKSY